MIVICRFEQLYEAHVESSEMTPGQMLLMGFAGMFSRLDADFTALLSAVSSVPTTDKYKKADLVREAAMLQVPVSYVNSFCSAMTDTVSYEVAIFYDLYVQFQFSCSSYVRSFQSRILVTSGIGLSEYRCPPISQTTTLKHWDWPVIYKCVKSVAF